MFAKTKSLSSLCFIIALAASRTAWGQPFGGFYPWAEEAPGSDATDIVAGDFDGDGVCDLAIVNTETSPGLKVLLNAGDGSFGVDDTEALGGQPKAVTAADLDGDGDLDLAAANWSSANVMVFLNDGSGDFSLVGTYAVGSAPRDIAAADLDGDCDLDLITTNQFGNSCSILENDGAAAFVVDVPAMPVGNRPSFLDLGDVDDDGEPDLVVSNENDAEVWIMLNDGSGGFGPPQTFAVLAPENNVFVDLDADRDLDVAFVTQECVLRVLKNDGTGNFALQPEAPASGDVAGICAGDFDNDGDPDIAAGNVNCDGNIVWVNLNLGDGTFAEGVPFEVDTGVRAVVCADFDGDWDVDVASANGWGDSVAILLNRESELSPSDANKDGCVDVRDFLELIGNWMACP
jgi:hypothetical protein